MLSMYSVGDFLLTIKCFYHLSSVKLVFQIFSYADCISYSDKDNSYGVIKKLSRIQLYLK